MSLEAESFFLLHPGSSASPECQPHGRLRARDRDCCLSVRCCRSSPGARTCPIPRCSPWPARRALLPKVPSVVLDPELALTLFVAPVLLDAAFDSSPRDLKENWRQITGLALLAVGLTVAAVALVAHALVPGLPW